MLCGLLVPKIYKIDKVLLHIKEIDPLSLHLPLYPKIVIQLFYRADIVVNGHLGQQRAEELGIQQ